MTDRGKPTTPPPAIAQELRQLAHKRRLEATHMNMSADEMDRIGSKALRRFAQINLAEANDLDRIADRTEGAQ